MRTGASWRKSSAMNPEDVRAGDRARSPPGRGDRRDLRHERGQYQRRSAREERLAARGAGDNSDLDYLLGYQYGSCSRNRAAGGIPADRGARRQARRACSAPAEPLSRSTGIRRCGRRPALYRDARPRRSRWPSMSLTMTKPSSTPLNRASSDSSGCRPRRSAFMDSNDDGVPQRRPVSELGRSRDGGFEENAGLFRGRIEAGRAVVALRDYQRDGDEGRRRRQPELRS